MESSYDITSLAYLRRARVCLAEGTKEALFYAAFELRSGTESRLQEYLDARRDIATRKKQGWHIIGSGKELDKNVQLGDNIYEARFLDEKGTLKMAAYYIPILARLRKAAGGPLHDLLHAMKRLTADSDEWWMNTRRFLEQIHDDLELANKGTLLAPLLQSRDRRHCYMTLAVADRNSGLTRKMEEEIAKVGVNHKISVKYHDSLPDHASPFLNDVGD
jgi:hypothetical protein